MCGDSLGLPKSFLVFVPTLSSIIEGPLFFKFLMLLIISFKLVLVQLSEIIFLKLKASPILIIFTPLINVS